MEAEVAANALAMEDDPQHTIIEETCVEEILRPNKASMNLLLQTDNQNVGRIRTYSTCNMDDVLNFDAEGSALDMMLQNAEILDQSTESWPVVSEMITADSNIATLNPAVYTQTCNTNEYNLVNSSFHLLQRSPVKSTVVTSGLVRNNNDLLKSGVSILNKDNLDLTGRRNTNSPSLNLLNSNLRQTGTPTPKIEDTPMEDTQSMEEPDFNVLHLDDNTITDLDSFPLFNMDDDMNSLLEQFEEVSQDAIQVFENTVDNVALKDDDMDVSASSRSVHRVSSDSQLFDKSVHRQHSIEEESPEVVKLLKAKRQLPKSAAASPAATPPSTPTAEMLRKIKNNNKTKSAILLPTALPTKGDKSFKGKGVKQTPQMPVYASRKLRKLLGHMAEDSGSETNEKDNAGLLGKESELKNVPQGLVLNVNNISETNSGASSTPASASEVSSRCTTPDNGKKKISLSAYKSRLNNAQKAASSSGPSPLSSGRSTPVKEFADNTQIIINTVRAKLNAQINANKVSNSYSENAQSKPASYYDVIMDHDYCQNIANKGSYRSPAKTASSNTKHQTVNSPSSSRSRTDQRHTSDKNRHSSYKHPHHPVSNHHHHNNSGRSHRHDSHRSNHSNHHQHSVSSQSTSHSHQLSINPGTSNSFSAHSVHEGQAVDSSHMPLPALLVSPPMHPLKRSDKSNTTDHHQNLSSRSRESEKIECPSLMADSTTTEDSDKKADSSMLKNLLLSPELENEMKEQAIVDRKESMKRMSSSSSSCSSVLSPDRDICDDISGTFSPEKRDNEDLGNVINNKDDDDCMLATIMDDIVGGNINSVDRKEEISDSSKPDSSSSSIAKETPDTCIVKPGRDEKNVVAVAEDVVVHTDKDMVDDDEGEIVEDLNDKENDNSSRFSKFESEIIKPIESGKELQSGTHNVREHEYISVKKEQHNRSHKLSEKTDKQSASGFDGRKHKRIYRKKGRSPSPEVDPEPYFDKLPNYCTALSLDNRKDKLSRTSSSSKLMDTSLPTRDRDPSPDRSIPMFDKVPAYYSCFTNSTKYDGLSHKNALSITTDNGYEWEKMHSRQNSVLSSRSTSPNLIHPRPHSRGQSVSRPTSRSSSRYSSRGNSQSRLSSRSRYSVSRSRSRSRSPPRAYSSRRSISVRSSRRCSPVKRKRSSYSSTSRSRSRSFSRSRSRSYNRSRSRSYSRSRSRSRSYCRGRRYRSRSRSVEHRRKRRRYSRSRSRSLSWDRWRVEQRKKREEEKASCMEERKIVYVGGIPNDFTRRDLRKTFDRFGDIEDISVHFREHGDNYGFVTFAYRCDAFAAIENGKKLHGCKDFDLCFGGRRQFCKSGYADLDGNMEEEEEMAPVLSKPKQNMDFDELLRQAMKKKKF